jgi:ribonuclease Z
MIFSLTVLGSNSSLPSFDRFSTAQVLNVNEQIYLIDCAEGTQIKFRKYKIKYGKLNHIFISHLHGDHYFGLFGLISSLNMLGRTEDLHIYSRPELKEIINCQISFSEPLNYLIIYHTINCKKHQVIHEDKYVSVESIPLKHRIPTCGFLFREKQKLKNIKKEAIAKYNIPIRDIVPIKEGADFVTEQGIIIPNAEITIPPPNPRTYAFCTDTVYKESIIKYIEKVDLLYHETTYMNDLAKRARETYHSTTVEAATIASKAKVGKLLIGHFSGRYKESEIPLVIAEAQRIFPNTIGAEDGMIIDIDSF